MGKERSILYGSSFFALTEDQKTAVREYYRDQTQTKTGSSRIDTTEIFRHQNFLATPLDYYAQKIQRIKAIHEADRFTFMSSEQRQNLEDELVFAFYIFCARYQLDYAEKRGRVLEERAEKITDCALLLNQLRSTPPIDAKKSPEQELYQVTTNGDSPVKYLVMQTICPLILETLKDIQDKKTQSSLDSMSTFNERRLYWVWAGGGGLLGVFVKLLSDDFYYKTQAQTILDIPAPFTGTLSWLLYYIRFGIRLGLLLYHSRPEAWMDENDEERNIPWHERFMMQVHQRKFALMNDFFWASANLACFFWLVGSGMPGYYGGVVTGILLLMDVSLAIWGFKEEKDQYIKDMARFNEDICILEALRDNKDDFEKPLIDRQIQDLTRAKRQCKLDWDYKLYALYADSLYAISLFCAFALVCSFFFPPAAVVPTTALICGIAGTVMCFALNSFFSAVKEGLKVSKAVTLKTDNIQDKKEILQRYCALQENDVFNRKQCYLDYKLLEEESAHHEEAITYQKMTLLRSTLIDLLVPPVVFVGLVFFPLGIGLPILAAALAIAVGFYYYIEANYKPSDVNLSAFDEVAFAEFNPAMELHKISDQDAPLGFFDCASEFLKTEEMPQHPNWLPDLS